MGEQTNARQPQQSKGIADRPPAPMPKKPIRNLRIGQLKPLVGAKTEVSFAVGTFDGVPPQATAVLTGFAEFEITSLGPARCSGVLDQPFEEVDRWHRGGGRVVILRK